MLLFLLIKKHYLFILIALTKRPSLNKIGKESRLCHFIEQSDVFCGISVLTELFKVEEVSRIKENIFCGVRGVL